MNIPYQANGIYPSEVAIVVNAARRHAINVFLESGIDNGYSTEQWATQLGCPVNACDMRYLPDTVARLAKYPNLTITQQYGHPFLHGQAKALASYRIGVFIDGPKYAEAASLCHELLVAYPHILFVAIHDALDPFEFDVLRDGAYRLTWSIAQYTDECAVLDREAEEFNNNMGASYSKGPGLLLVER